MKIDKNEFFRKAAMQICGDLNIDRAMFYCLEILKEYVPADIIVLFKTEVGLKSIRRIAVATGQESHKLNDLLLLKDENVRSLLKNEQPDIRIINDIRKDSFTSSTFSFFEDQTLSLHYTPYENLWDSSMMVMVLKSKGRSIGAVALRVEGTGKYNNEHLELFSLLHEPFTIALSNTLRHRELKRLKDMLRDDNQYLNREMMNLSGTDIIGSDFGLKDIIDMTKLIAPLNSPVLLLGETGVGKEVIANLIHSSSTRKDGPFIKLNCGAIPENLIDSELFGHEKGAFTGATGQKRGRFERAVNGSIFLDEIGELPLQAQVRLLRTIQNGEIERVGGTETISVNTRIIAATNRNLIEMVDNNQFREDLWFRLNVFPITIPPLRSRKEDIPQFLDHFIQVKSKALGLHPVPKIDYGAIDRLKNYHWPGNVRELENVIERELVLCGKGTLQFNHSSLPGFENSHKLQIQHDHDLIRLNDVIIHHISRVLTSTNGRVNGKGGAAELLDIKSGTLRSKMDKLGINYKKNVNRNSVC